MKFYNWRKQREYKYTFVFFKMSGVITLINESYVTDLWCKKHRKN